MLGAFGAYPAVIRLLGEDLRLTSSDGEVGLWDLEDLSVVQFAVVGTMTECLEPSLLSGFDVTLISPMSWGRHAV